SRHDGRGRGPTQSHAGRGRSCGARRWTRHIRHGDSGCGRFAAAPILRPRPEPELPARLSSIPPLRSNWKFIMARAPNRWTNNAPVALITEEGDFNWFVRQLRLGAALLGSVKARAVVGVLDGIVWQANVLAAYVVVGDCRGLLQFSTNNNTVEIEQWVT